MESGATLGRRFSLRHREDHDLPGVERWIAHDHRRDVPVTLDVLVSLAPAAVRRAAVRAAQVRDARFARVLASGRETVGEERVTYVVTERPRGIRLDTVVGERVLTARLAGSIIGEAARALSVASAADVHHGYVRASALTVTRAGRVVVSGLNADGELATQAGLGRGHSEMSDAMALARLYLTLITGKDPDEVTAGDVPELLPPAAHDLALATVAGTEPRTFTAIARATGPSDPEGLRNFRSVLRGLPFAPGALAKNAPAATATSVSLAPDVLPRAEHMAAIVVAARLATPEVASQVADGRVEHAAVAAIQTVDGPVPVPPEVAAQYSKRTRRAAARHADEQLGLETWQDIATEQNATVPPSGAQALLEWLETRWPRSVALSTAADQARHRAQRAAPLNSGPMLLGAFLAVTVVVGIVSFAVMTSPFEPDFERSTRPPVNYPEFTFSPSPSPTVTDGE